MRTHILLGFTGAFLLAFALGAYMIYEPWRMEQARAALLTERISAGQVAYAENCAVCHGAAGEGLGANPALNSEGLRGTDYDTLYKTIVRGRYNTAMPAWGVSDGGPLNDDAIEALILLIQFGDWQTTRTVVADLGMAPRAPLSVTIPTETLALIAGLAEGAPLAEGAQTYAANCIACHGSNGQGTPLAPALNDPALRASRTAEQLTTTISFGVAGTVMAGWNQRLTPEQISQLVALIQRWGELPPAAIPEPPAQPLIVTEKLLETGAALYTQTCARCHGPEGQGTPRAPALNVQSFFQKVTTDAAMIQIVTHGVPGTAMPAWGDRLSASEIEAVTAFVRAWEATAPAVAQPSTAPGGGPPWRQNNPAPNAPQAPNGATTTAPASAFEWRSGLLLGAVGVSVSAALVSSIAALWKLRGAVSPAPAPRLNE